MFASFFLIYVLAMLGVLLWNAVVCFLVFRRRRFRSWCFRYAHYTAMMLMLPGLICDIGGTDPKAPFLLWAAWLYPTAFFLAAAASLGSLRRDGFRWWLVPVPLFNLLLGFVYLTRYLAYLGVPLGLPLDGLQVSYAIAQSLIVSFLYTFFPILNNWPVLLLPASETRRSVRRLNVVPILACGLLVGLIVGLYPRGYQIAASWQRPVPATARLVPRPEFRPGVVLRVAPDSAPTDEYFRRELAAIQDLGVRAVNLFVHDDLMADETKAASVGRFLERLREQNVTIILTADYPSVWFAHPPANRMEILSKMQPFHTFLATRYRPDILVPFIEPYGAFPLVARATYSPEEWIEMLTTATDAIHEADPAVRCAVYFGHSDNDRALYQLVCRPDSPVDVVGFSVYALYQTREEMDEILATVQGWMKKYARNREHWIFESGQSPLTMGGERAQSQYVQWITGWASRQLDMRGSCVFALRDYAERTGLVNSLGRKRRAYRDYQKLVTAVHGAVWETHLRAADRTNEAFRQERKLEGR